MADSAASSRSCHKDVSISCSMVATSVGASPGPTPRSIPVSAAMVDAGLPRTLTCSTIPSKLNASSFRSPYTVGGGISRMLRYFVSFTTPTIRLSGRITDATHPEGLSNRVHAGIELASEALTHDRGTRFAPVIGRLERATPGDPHAQIREVVETHAVQADVRQIGESNAAAGASRGSLEADAAHQRTLRQADCLDSRKRTCPPPRSEGQTSE